MPGPLENVRVVDLTTVVMGPYAGRILGDLGAEVFKVEKLADERTGLGGDSTRRLGASRNPGMGSYFINLLVAIWKKLFFVPGPFAADPKLSPAQPRRST